MKSFFLENANRTATKVLFWYINIDANVPEQHPTADKEETVTHIHIDTQTMWDRHVQTGLSRKTYTHGNVRPGDMRVYTVCPPEEILL